ncbi:hypothetical protein ACVWXU_006430 [Streptomyces sp. TE33382]
MSASKSIAAFFAPRSLEHWYQVYEVQDGGPPFLTISAQSRVKAIASGEFIAGLTLSPSTVKSLSPLRAYIVMKPGWIVAQLREPRTATPYIPSKPAAGALRVIVPASSRSSSKDSAGLTPSFLNTSVLYATTFVSQPHGSAYCPPRPSGAPAFSDHWPAWSRFGKKSAWSHSAPVAEELRIQGPRSSSQPGGPYCHTMYAPSMNTSYEARPLDRSTVSLSK